MKKIDSNKGITLVALIITIIILLILAGVTIAQLTGNGLFQNAKLAKEKHGNAQNTQNLILSEYEDMIENYEVSSNRENQGNGYFLKVYKDDVLSDDIPPREEGYRPVEISCTNGATATFDTNTWSLSINGITTREVVCTIKFKYIGSVYGNANVENVKSFSADGYSGTNIPKNAIDGSMTNGNGYNWYEGTKLLIEYNSLSSITDIAVYTTNNWGYSMGSATIYYSEDDSLALDSDLSQFKSITINTESKQTLPSEIQAKRVMLVKGNTNAVYEFQCFGSYM